jgi:hypothetical protein
VDRISPALELSVVYGDRTLRNTWPVFSYEIDTLYRMEYGRGGREACGPGCRKGEVSRAGTKPTG